jgi:dTDP-4-dehydrorhamnose reductase
MKILILGKNGQLGWELQRALAPLGTVIALGRTEKAYCGDLSKPQALLETIHSIRPNILVNAAAFTAVDKAESETELAFQINAETVGLLAKAMAEFNGWIVHYSTDYIFNGEGDVPWLETDAPFPLNRYGQSKLAGEEAIRQQKGKHLIFRTSWVYARRGSNFIKTILNLAEERESLSIVADQIGAPTGADLLADVTAHAIPACLNKPELSGTYHLAPQGAISWFDYADFIWNEAKRLGRSFRLASLSKTTSQEYPRPAVRPLNSRLNTAKLCKAFSLHMPPWQDGVQRVISDIIGNPL